MQPVTELGADTLRDYYETFARVETGTSPIYSAWAQGVAEDDELLALLLDLPGPKRQANLLFAAARHLGAGDTSYVDLRSWLLEHWADTRRLMLARSTQTNEAGRCATLLPALAAIPGPLALLEVGASAGLCLYPDRYSYRYAVVERRDPTCKDDRASPADPDTQDDRAGREAPAREDDPAAGFPTAAASASPHDRAAIPPPPASPAPTIRLDPPSGPSEVVIDCDLTNAPVPDRLPDVAWRAGIDLNPIDITDADQRAWLRSLVWPEHETRRQRLLAASSIAAADPPRLVRGDLLDTIEPLLDEVPAGTRPVIFHSAVLAYVDAEARARFASLMQTREDVVWISNEGAGVLPETRGQLEALGVDAGGRFVLTVNGVAQALSGPHGQSYEGLPMLGAAGSG